MGLASVYGTLKNHCESISVQSEPGHGTTTKLYLPQTTSDYLPDLNQTAHAESIRGSAHILLVDDEKYVLETAKQDKEIAKIRKCEPFY